MFFFFNLNNGNIVFSGRRSLPGSNNSIPGVIIHSALVSDVPVLAQVISLTVPPLISPSSESFPVEVVSTSNTFFRSNPSDEGSGINGTVAELVAVNIGVHVDIDRNAFIDRTNAHGTVNGGDTLKIRDIGSGNLVIINGKPSRRSSKHK